MKPWFGTGAELIDFSRDPVTGLTKNGLIYARVGTCELFRDTALMGPVDDIDVTRLGERRRGREFQAVPCKIRLSATLRYWPVGQHRKVAINSLG